jgi:hypothetical protein
MKAEVWAAIVILAIAAIAGFVAWERHQGAQSVKVHDQVAVANKIAQNARQEVKDTHEVAKEKADYDQANLAPVAAPSVRLCHYTPAMPRAHPAGPDLHAGATDRAQDLPGPGQGGQPLPSPDLGEDIGPDLIRHAREADLLLAGAQAYIRNVCLVQH